MNLQKSVLITGAGSGIGRACAEDLYRRGYQVFAAVRQLEKCEAFSAGISTFELDITDTNAIQQSVKQLPPLNGLVNNAGIVSAGPLAYLSLDELRQQLEVNVIAQLAVTQACLPLLSQTQGRIINMGSISGHVSYPLIGAYAASKHALEALTDALRVELTPLGIQVIIIEPGRIPTPLWEKSVASAETASQSYPKHNPYLTALKKLRQSALKSATHGTPVQAVCDAVAHALMAPKPKTRYWVGNDAKLAVLLKALLPDRCCDWLAIRKLGLERAKAPEYSR